MADYQTNSKKLLLTYSAIILVVGLVIGYFIGRSSSKSCYTPSITSSQSNYGTVCKTCKEIRTCDEAKRLLASGCRDLDRDGDGVPCETLCGKRK